MYICYAKHSSTLFMSAFFTSHCFFTCNCCGTEAPIDVSFSKWWDLFCWRFLFPFASFLFGLLDFLKHFNNNGKEKTNKTARQLLVRNASWSTHFGLIIRTSFLYPQLWRFFFIRCSLDRIRISDILCTCLFFTDYRYSFWPNHFVLLVRMLTMVVASFFLHSIPCCGSLFLYRLFIRSFFPNTKDLNRLKFTFLLDLLLSPAVFFISVFTFSPIWCYAIHHE